MSIGYWGKGILHREYGLLFVNGVMLKINADYSCLETENYCLLATFPFIWNKLEKIKLSRNVTIVTPKSNYFNLKCLTLHSPGRAFPPMSDNSVFHNRTMQIKSNVSGCSFNFCVSIEQQNNPVTFILKAFPSSAHRA